MEQTATHRRGSAIAKCVQGAARQLRGDYFPESSVISIITAHGFGMQVLFSGPVSSNSYLGRCPKDAVLPSLGAVVGAAPDSTLQ